MDDMKLWVVCPSYRDVPSFTILRSRVLEVMASASRVGSTAIEFILVDDTGGCDVETDRLQRFPDVTVLSPPFNVGHQRALVYGLRKILPELADSDVIVTMDADGEDRPEDLPALLDALFNEHSNYTALCVARRTKREESLRFKLFYILFRAMFHILTGTTVRSGNFAAYRGWLARRILLHPYFDLCYSSTLVSLDIAITAVPCARGQRYEGQSRMGYLRLFMHGVRMLMPFTDRIAVRALTAFSAMFGIGILLAFSVVGIRVFSTSAIPGWATFTLLGFLILSFIALGNFIVLFAVFTHSRGISLSDLEEWNVRGSRNASTTSD
jgi:glycosyltransferase involved in cell wall biosynthesis